MDTGTGQAIRKVTTINPPIRGIGYSIWKWFHEFQYTA
jgi:hypothetical protein